MKEILKHLIRFVPFLLYIVIIGVLFFPAFTAPTNQYLFGWDTMDFEYFTRSYYVQAIRSGQIPWWNPYQFAGVPFAAGVGGPIFFYPLSIMSALLPVSQALTWFYAVHIFIAMTGMYVLMRRFVRAEGAWVSGIIFGLSGYFVPRVLAGTTGNLAAAAYLPLVFWGFFRAFDAKGKIATIRAVTLAAILLCLQFLAGDQRMAVYTMMGVGFASIMYALWIRRVMPIIIVFTGFFSGYLISAVQSIPILEYMLLSGRGKIPSYPYASSGSLTSDRLWEFIYPIAKRFTPNIQSYPPFPEGPFYAGIIPLLIACAGVVFLAISAKRMYKSAADKKILTIGTIYIGILIFSLWISLGSAAPVDLFYLLWRYVPMFSFVRIPTRFLLLFAFGVAGLVGLTVSQIRNKYVRIIMILVILVELFPFARSYLILSGVPESRNNAELIQTLKQDGLFRVHPNYFYTERLGNAMDMDGASHYRYFSTQGYSPLILSSYIDFYSAACLTYDPTGTLGMNQLPPMSTTHSPCLDFLNVKYVYGRGDMTAPTDIGTFKLVIDNPYSWFRLYENNSYLPRFFMAREATFYKNSGDVVKALKSGTPDIRDSVLLVDPKKAAAQPNEKATCLTTHGTVRVVSYGINKVTLETNTPCDAYLVSSEVMYPGWGATIDGKSVPIETGNLAFRTIFVPAGPHRIEMKYSPRTFCIGGAITTITLVVIIAFCVKRRTTI